MIESAQRPGIIFALTAMVVLLLADNSATGATKPESALDALDVPRALAAAPDGGFWVGLQTDTFGGIVGYDADGSERLSFMPRALEPVLAVDGAGDLFIGGFSDYGLPTMSYIARYSSDGRHQRSWIVSPMVIVDLDKSPTDTIFALQQVLEHDEHPLWPLVADRIISYSTSGLRLDEWTTTDALTEIAIDPEGGIFVAHAARDGRSRIEEVHPDGSRSGAFDIEGSVIGMDFGISGDLFVAVALKGARGIVVRYRPTFDGADKITEWDTCDKPVDLSVVGEENVVVLVHTPVRDFSISAICQYDGLGAVTRSFQIPMFTGRPAPLATPVAGEVNWLPIAVRRH